MAPKSRLKATRGKAKGGVQSTANEEIQQVSEMSSGLHAIEDTSAQSSDDGFEKRDISLVATRVPLQQSSTFRMNMQPEVGLEIGHPSQHSEPLLLGQSCTSSLSGPARPVSNVSSTSHLSKKSSKSEDSSRAQLSARPLRPPRTQEEAVTLQKCEWKRAKMYYMMKGARRVDEEQQRKDVDISMERKELEKHQCRQHGCQNPQHYEKKVYHQQVENRREDYDKHQRKPKQKKKCKTSALDLPPLTFEVDRQRGVWIRRGIYVNGKKPPGPESRLRTLNPWKKIKSSDTFIEMTSHFSKYA
jgi:hypothetical protein